MPQPQPNLTRRGLFGNGLWAAVVAAVAGLLHRALSAGEDEAGRTKVRAEVRELCGQYPLPHA